MLLTSAVNNNNYALDSWIIIYDHHDAGIAKVMEDSHDDSRQGERSGSQTASIPVPRDQPPRTPSRCKR